MRLAFATVTAIEADILLMDEVIGTGDAAFIEKAERRLKSFMSRSKILVIASHSDHVIRSLCNKAVLLSHGCLVRCGSVEDVMQTYAKAAPQSVA
jgi:ABC-type polysaccharide/polyol phosphate transport system ATPase subunit